MELRIIPAAVAGWVTLFTLASGASAEDGKPAAGVYEGKWVNRRWRTTGPLVCTMQPAAGAEWTARFEGKFKNDPFAYDASFEAKKAAGRYDLSGTTLVDGDRNEWTGTLKGDVLTIRYRSQKGYNGEFTLKRKADSKRK